jgi:hypothetical protein
MCVRVFALGGGDLTEDADIPFGSQAMTSFLRMSSECSLRVYKDPHVDSLRNYSLLSPFPSNLF